MSKDRHHDRRSLLPYSCNVCYYHLGLVRAVCCRYTKHKHIGHTDADRRRQQVTRALYRVVTKEQSDRASLRVKHQELSEIEEGQAKLKEYMGTNNTRSE